MDKDQFNEVYIKIGKRIRQARKAQKLTQQELARKAGIDLASSCIGKWEMGEQYVKIPYLMQIAKATNHSLLYFLDNLEPSYADRPNDEPTRDRGEPRGNGSGPGTGTENG